MERTDVPRMLLVGYFDPESRGGIQAQLKTAAAFGVYAASVITGVQGAAESGELSYPVPLDEFRAQLDLAIAGTAPAAAAIGSLGSPEHVKMVSRKLAEAQVGLVVVKPRFGGLTEATGRDVEGLVEAVKSDLLPISKILVPNISECEVLAGIKVQNTMGMRAGAKLIQRQGPGYVVVTGAQLEGEECTDYLFDGKEYMDLPSERVQVNDSSGFGLGDTYTAAIAAGLALQRPPEEAVAIAKLYVTECLSRALSLTDGRSGLNHLYGWWEGEGSRGYGG